MGLIKVRENYHRNLFGIESDNLIPFSSVEVQMMISYPQMSDRCYTDSSLIVKLQRTIYCVNMQNISSLFG